MVGFLKASAVEDSRFRQQALAARDINNIFANFIDNCRVGQYDASAMTRPERNVRAGKKLRRIRRRLDLSVRDVERISHENAVERHNPFLALSRTWIADVETGRFVPGSFKMASLADILRNGPLPGSQTVRPPYGFRTSPSSIRRIVHPQRNC